MLLIEKAVQYQLFISVMVTCNYYWLFSLRGYPTVFPTNMKVRMSLMKTNQGLR